MTKRASRKIFGPKHDTVVQRFQHAKWRGDQLDEVVYYRRSENYRLESEIVETFLASPASASIRRLTFGHSEPTPRMAKILASLPRRPFATSLNTLVLTTEMPYTGKGEIDLAPFTQLPALERLSIAAPLRRPKFYRELAERLVELGVAPLGAAAVRTLFPAGGYPRLRELTFTTTGSHEAPILSGRATPKLEVLRVIGPADHQMIVDQLAKSALLPRLRELHFWRLEHLGARCAPASLGPEFAHLARVIVRRGWAPATRAR